MLHKWGKTVDLKIWPNILLQQLTVAQDGTLRERYLAFLPFCTVFFPSEFGHSFSAFGVLKSWIVSLL